MHRGVGNLLSFTHHGTSITKPFRYQHTTYEFTYVTALITGSFVVAHGGNRTIRIKLIVEQATLDFEIP